MNRIIRIIRKLKLTDDEFMSVVYRDKKVVEHTIEVILNRKVRIADVYTQYEIRGGTGRTVILDVYAIDERGVLFNIEFENRVSRALFERLQYHSSMMDRENVKKGMKFKYIPYRYVICFTRGNPSGSPGPVSKAQLVWKDSKKELKSYAEYVYVNISDTEGDDPVHRYIRSLDQPDWRKMEDPVLKERTEYLKAGEGAKEMSEIIRQFRKEERKAAMKKGERRGREKGKAEVAMNMYREGMDVQDISRLVKEDVETVNGWALKAGLISGR